MQREGKTFSSSFKGEWHGSVSEGFFFFQEFQAENYHSQT